MDKEWKFGKNGNNLIPIFMIRIDILRIEELKKFFFNQVTQFLLLYTIKMLNNFYYGKYRVQNKC